MSQPIGAQDVVEDVDGRDAGPGIPVVRVVVTVLSDVGPLALLSLRASNVFPDTEVRRVVVTPTLPVNQLVTAAPPYPVCQTKACRLDIDVPRNGETPVTCYAAVERV